MTEPYLRRLFDQYAGRYDAALMRAPRRKAITIGLSSAIWPRFCPLTLPKPQNTIWCWRPMCSSTSTTLSRCSPMSLGCWRRAACSRHARA